jgi:anaerobic selenocysteine-containing dehydrogenase
MPATATTTRTTCRLCLVRCGMLVETDETGQVTRLVGDKAHPLSKGFLCVKGKASVAMAASDKRVIYPQQRVGERGSGKWRRVSWDEALEDIAARMQRIIDAHGARAIAVQALPPKEYFAFDLFAKAIGSPTFFKHDSHQCFTPQLMADTLTYGNLLTYPSFTDVSEADVLLLWGVNLKETNGCKDQRVRDAQRRHGTQTVVIDPRPTATAQAADLWLGLRPGTDAALALGMLHVMLENGWYDRRFVADWTLGFDALVALTWVPAADLVAAARLFATAERSALYTFIGATMGGNSVATLRLMGFLPALTGKLDTPGNNGFLAPVGHRMPGYFGAEAIAGIDMREQLSADKFPLLAGPEAVTTPYPHPRQVIDAMLTGEPYPVRALWTDCNPLVGLEDSYTTLAALKSLDLLVVSDMFVSPTAYLADYILPITTHLESNAITEYSGLNIVSARRRAVPPRGEAREEGEPVLEVVRRLGLIDKLPVKDYRELLDYRLAPLGVTFDEFAEQQTVVREDTPQKYRAGRLRRDGAPGFNTPSGKIEFVSGVLARHGYDPLPDYVEPPYSPLSTPELARDYPLIMISGTRSVEYYSTLGIDLDRLRRRRPWPTLEMGEATAAGYGLSDGDWVRIGAPTTDKTIVRRVAILPGMHPGLVNAEGLWTLPEFADPVAGTLAVGANVLTSLRDDVDPVLGGSVARCLLCRVEKIDVPEEIQPAA